jgi:hypothetical protein
MITTDIKNLAIALEALSRIPDSMNLSERVRFELNKFVSELVRRRQEIEELRTTGTGRDPNYE